MYNDGLKKKFMLYSGERYQASEKDKSHSYLLLVQETPDETGRRKVIEKIHFNGEVAFDPRLGHSRLFMVDRSGPIKSKIRLDENKYLETMEGPHRAIIGGDEEHMTHVWNYAKDIAKKIESLKLQFNLGEGRHNNNCRAGTIAILTKLGLPFTRLNPSERGTSGLDANLAEIKEIKNLPNFDGHVKPSPVQELAVA